MHVVHGGNAVERGWLDHTARPLPVDPADLWEWSLVMALTDVLNAIYRGLAPANREIVVPGSGCYTATTTRCAGRTPR